MRENGKIEHSLDVYKSQILRLAAVGGGKKTSEPRGGEPAASQSQQRHIQVGANVHGLAGAQMRMSCVNQEAGSARMRCSEGKAGRALGEGRGETRDSQMETFESDGFGFHK